MSVGCNRSSAVKTLARVRVTEMFLCSVHLHVDQLQGPHSILSDGYKNHYVKLFFLLNDDSFTLQIHNSVISPSWACTQLQNLTCSLQRTQKFKESLSSNILIYIQQDATLHSLFYLETALHISGGTTTHHQDRKQLYLQHLVFVTPLLLSAAIMGELELV